ncbi:PstS family phosphate ABC transporter substrate-binding protein [Candidatus Chloroploca asiatica]|uniref:Phosphate-binding protein n=1 Tax=Candidatus Chloroploca asiatica TaxID=1506545 RepID=A0A2H3L8I7_9CHLR|nr:PstS family phosphate ABC transporter substrate-binding protein [Candidatus Chloroploca asiatica]PDV98610.1 phosphate-binding protein [Candidatus Chloroploca asiatica]
MAPNFRRLMPLFMLLALLLPILVACGGAPAATPTDAPVAQATDAPAATAVPEPTAAPEATAEPEPTVAPEPTTPPATGDVVQLPEVNPADYSGDIIIAGSSTVFPLTERMAELFIEDGFTGQITIDSIGSGAGYERFCTAAESDIANASRPIRDTELAACETSGRPALEFRVGTDALAVVVSTENDFITNATIEELAEIFGTATNWSDVNSSWPNEPIQRFIPGTDSGTFDYFVEEVFDEDPAVMLSASNTQLSEDDNVLVQGILGSPYAIGFFGYAYYEENASRLNILDIEGVEPTAESTEDGSYPLARPLFIFSAANIMAEKPQVAAFINYYLTFVGDEVVDVGYFPASVNAINAAKNRWLQATGGEVEPIALPEVDPSAFSGDIIIAGSSTVFPLTERMAELFIEDGFTGQITIDSIGSGAGYERFCTAAESDIANASRPIRDTELAACETSGRPALEFRVGTDALAVVVSTENDFITNATIEELAEIFGTATNWSDVNSSWPNEPIQRFIPGTDSGTFDYFVEEVFDEDPAVMLSASNTQLSEDDNVLVQGILGSPYAIGFFGYAYYEENASRLNILDIEGVEPTAESTEDGSYPLARPLFIFSAANIMAEKPQVAAFINYYLTFVGDEVVDVGYFPASVRAINAAKTNWLEAN